MIKEYSNLNYVIYKTLMISVELTIYLLTCFLILWFSQVVTPHHQAQGDSEYLWLNITGNYIHFGDDRMIMMTWISTNKLNTSLLLALEASVQVYDWRMLKANKAWELNLIVNCHLSRGRQD